ncbi:MAG: hypothetical protein A2X08_02400 [Bacteroidetes bacterium GWA2_32_17]|nr:MAG: hypothetical protein A2X08_02400 [Bacteroidetes bacterium GWA2_32_17]
MKKIYFLIVLVTMMLVTINVKSQIDIVDGITYQAVVVDENGKEIAGMDINGIIIPEKAVNVRFTILKGSSSGNIEYQETQIVNTDATGLFSLIIGHGQVTSNSPNTSILNVSWGTNKHFLKVEIDINGAGDYIITGVEQMMAVPYAFWALGYHEKDSIKWSGPFDKYGDIGRWGNVGIGDTIPTQKLDVNGQIRMRGGMPANTKFFVSSSDGTASWDSLRSIITSGTGLTWNGNTINSVWTQSGNNIFNNNLGNVGIGNYSPAEKLDVDGGHTILQNSSSDINLYLKTKTSGAYLSNLFFLNFAGTGYGGISGDQTNTRVNIWMGATPNGNEKLTVLSSGNVGIGSTAPTQKLDINGQIKIQGGNPAPGKVLTSDATGVATWQPPVPVGGIIMYSGAWYFDATGLGTGTLDGWALCDGQGGRPDLRDRFVMGASTSADLLALGGDSSITINSEAQLPSHSHPFTTSSGGGGTFPLDITSDGNHSHPISDPGHSHTVNDLWVDWQNNGTLKNFPDGTDGYQYSTTETTSTAVTGISLQSAGQHNHSGSTVTLLDHPHSGTTGLIGSGSPIPYLPPFLKLAYIMRIY